MILVWSLFFDLSSMVGPIKSLQFILYSSPDPYGRPQYVTDTFFIEIIKDKVELGVIWNQNAKNIKWFCKE